MEDFRSKLIHQGGQKLMLLDIADTMDEVDTVVLHIVAVLAGFRFRRHHQFAAIISLLSIEFYDGILTTFTNQSNDVR